MLDYYAIWTFIGALITATLLAALITIANAPSPAVRAAIWRRQYIADNGSFWRKFQEEVMGELSKAPRLAPPRAGRPAPSSVAPPIYLYHGTARKNLASVFARGIEGRSGGWAFAAGDYQTAESYGKRWGADFMVFRILAQQAYQNGVVFETRGGYYVTRHIHPAYIDFHWTLGDFAQRNRMAA